MILQADVPSFSRGSKAEVAYLLPDGGLMSAYGAKQNQQVVLFGFNWLRISPDAVHLVTLAAPFHPPPAA